AAAAHLPSHLSHKAALVLLPPPAICPPIEAVRRLRDRHFARWPPHINLLYPFLASPSEPDPASQQGDSPRLRQDIRARIQHAVRGAPPFHVSLSADPAGIFSHSKRSKTVWLGPSSTSVQQLQAALQAEFSDCDADKRPFTPHLSVGQANSDSASAQLREEIKNSVTEFIGDSRHEQTAALDWYVDRVYVIERKGFHGRFKVIGEVELQK
ncbi:hypothetical protein BS50DRAFT_463765, partial [Corynespora cassiicola Philippines]